MYTPFKAKIYYNKNAFQWDTYRPRTDRIPVLSVLLEGRGLVFLPGGRDVGVFLSGGGGFIS